MALPSPPLSLPTTPPSSPSTYATLSFHKSNTLRLLNFPQDLTSALEPLLIASWPPGLESHAAFNQSYEYKFRDSPFGTYRRQRHVGGIRLLRDVLAFLYTHGWEIVTTVLCSHRYTAKDTLIFRRRVAPMLPAAVEWLGLAPMGTRSLSVVYDASGVRLSGPVVDGGHDHLGVLIMAIRKMLEERGCFEKGDWSHDSFEFELKGKPWRSRGEESVKMRIMLMQLLETMEAHGWRLYTTVVQRTGTDEYRVLDTWYFVREREGERVQKAAVGSAVVDSEWWLDS